MDRPENSPPSAQKGSPRWVRVFLILLIIEKIIQHTAVTLAFYVDWHAIRSSVAVNPDVLMVLGALSAGLFALGLWGVQQRKPWALNLVLALAAFDLLGEFIAQGKLAIMLNVSFLVASGLVVLCLVERGRTRD